MLIREECDSFLLPIFTNADSPELPFGVYLPGTQYTIKPGIRLAGFPVTNQERRFLLQVVISFSFELKHFTQFLFDYPIMMIHWHLFICNILPAAIPIRWNLHLLHKSRWIRLHRRLCIQRRP